MDRKKLLKGYIMVLISAVMFGCMPLITTYIYAEGIQRESVVLLRNLLSLPVLALLTWRQSGSFKFNIKALPSIAAIALMGCCVTPLLLYTSYPMIGTGTATVFHFVYPAVVVLIGVIFMKKKLSVGTIVAVVLCVVGICLFYDPNAKMNWAGCGLALASGVTYAIYVVLLSAFKHQEITGFKLSFLVAAICAVVMLAVCLITDKLTLPHTWSGWLLCLLLALVINVGAVVLFQMGTFWIGGERASILSTVEPITGVVVGALVFDEKVTIGVAAGSVLVITASILIAIFDSKKKK